MEQFQYNKFKMPADCNLYNPRWMIADAEPDRETGQFFDWFAVEFWTQVIRRI
jgi:hypothetical protein